MLLPLLDQFKDDTPIEHVFVVEDSYEELLATRRPGRVGGSRARRERGGRHVLHERHDGHAERRRLLAPLDDPPHARRRLGRAARSSAVRIRHVPAGRADVPRERVGVPVPRDDDGREPRLPGAAPRRREPARRVRAGGGDVDGGRADDLARHPRAARRESRQVGPLQAQGHALRRLGAAARDDRRVQDAPQPLGRPRLGHDGDVAGGVCLRPARATEGRGVAEAARLHRDAGDPAAVRRASRSRWRRQRDPWDDETMGELEIRGPWVASGYYDTPSRRSAGRTTAGS